MTNHAFVGSKLTRQKLLQPLLFLMPCVRREDAMEKVEKRYAETQFVFRNRLSIRRYELDHRIRERAD